MCVSGSSFTITIRLFGGITTLFGLTLKCNPVLSIFQMCPHSPPVLFNLGIKTVKLLTNFYQVYVLTVKNSQVFGLP